MHTEPHSPGGSIMPLQNTESSYSTEWTRCCQKGSTERICFFGGRDSSLQGNFLKYGICNHTSETTKEGNIIPSPPSETENPMPNAWGTGSGTHFINFQLPLEKIKEEPGHHSLGQANTIKNAVQVPKDNIVKYSQPRSFDLKTYKSMGFKSSFLRHTQEREEKDDGWDDWRPLEK